MSRCISRRGNARAPRASPQLPTTAISATAAATRRDPPIREPTAGYGAYQTRAGQPSFTFRTSDAPKDGYDLAEQGKLVRHDAFVRGVLRDEGHAPPAR